MQVYLVNNRLYSTGVRKGGWFDLSTMEVEAALEEVVGAEMVGTGSVYWQALGYKEAPVKELLKYPTVEQLKAYQELSEKNQVDLIKEYVDADTVAGLNEEELVEKYWEETAEAWLKEKGID